MFHRSRLCGFSYTKKIITYIYQCLPSQGRVFFLFSELDLAAVLEPCWCNASTISGWKLRSSYAVTVCVWGARVLSPVFPRGEGKASRRLTSFPRKSPQGSSLDPSKRLGTRRNFHDNKLSSNTDKQLEAILQSILKSRKKKVVW